MRMPTNPRQASTFVDKAMSLDNVIVTPVKQKTSVDVAKEKKAKKAPARKKAAK